MQTTAGEWSESVAYQDVGVRLQVTVKRLASGRFAMHMVPEVSELVDWTAQGYPVVGTRNLNTRVSLAPNQALVLGGFCLNKKHQSRKRTPVLSRLPLIGGLFQSRELEDSRRDVWLMVRATEIEIKNGDRNE